MDAQQKKTFIEDYFEQMKASALRAVSVMPENWDGHEIRQYVADEAEFNISALMREKRSSRKRDYKNAYICMPRV